MHYDVRTVNLLLENFDFLRHILTTTAIRSSRAIATARRNSSLTSAAKIFFHAQICTILSAIISSGPIRLTPEQWVQKVAC